VPQVILNQTSVCALVGKKEAASVAQHVGMGEQGQGSGGAVFSQGQVYGGSVQRLPLLAERQTPCRSASCGRVLSAMR